MAQSSLIGGFTEHARYRPDAAALVGPHGEISYGLLDRSARRQQRRLRALLGGADEPVAIVADKSPEGIALILGCLLARVRFLLLAPTAPPELQRRLAEQAGCVAQVSVRTGHRLAGRPGSDGPAGVSFMLTTSGSTGAPKIVPLPDAAVDRFTTWAHQRFDVGPGRSVLNYAPLSFDLCLLDVWATLRHGGRVVLVDTAAALSGPYLIELIRRHRPHVVQSIPLFYRLIADAAVDGGESMSGVEHVIFTGDTLPRRYLGVLPELFPDARLYNVYGCTETNDSFLSEADAAWLPDGPAPLGHPLPGVTALLTDPAGTVFAGPGVGELYVHTPFQADGYLGGDRFPPAPDGSHSGLRFFRSGDLVRRHADGGLTLEGRTDHQVKIRGSRVNTAEVERVLLDHPEIAEAAVVTTPDATAGLSLCAVLRRVPGSTLNSLALRRHCAMSLMPAAIPATIQITDTPLPRTSTGKVDRTLITARTGS